MIKHTTFDKPQKKLTRKKFEKGNPKIALNVLYVKRMNIYLPTF